MTNATIEVSNENLKLLDQGLAALDGLMGEGGSMLRFVFDSEKAWHIALNRETVLRALGAHRRADAQLKAVHEVVEKMEITPLSAPKISKYLAEKENLDAQTQKLELFLFCRKDLQNQAKGKIPPSALMCLRPILTDE